MRSKLTNLTIWMFLVPSLLAQCPSYVEYSKQQHGPPRTGKHFLSFQRPPLGCRTFNSSIVEDTIIEMKATIRDNDLARLFENTFPNTLDTAVKWKGFSANNPREELTFLITGDINAMWLRDSANQMQSYVGLLKADSSYASLASLFRGVINLQARYILTSPHCNSFQPPVESGIIPEIKTDEPDNAFPQYSNKAVFECKYELDSLAAFLQISTDYYETTGDIQFFRDFHWVEAVNKIMKTTEALTTGTYAANGSVNKLPYTFQRRTQSGTETLPNSGRGNPVQSGIGLIRSAFRPSDDSTIYQFLIPSNMMFSRYLNSTSTIMQNIGDQNTLFIHMNNLSVRLQAAINKFGVVDDPVYGKVYAFEIDGYGSANRMDDANIPSLLSAPFIGYFDLGDPVYQNTRKWILSKENPYFMRGPVINAVGGPHAGLGYAWPMANIMRIFTTDDDREIRAALKELVSSTNYLGIDP